MDNIVLIGIYVVVVIVIVAGLYFWHQKKTKSLRGELNLFKREKEYSSEAMMVLSENYNVLFANQTAKSLFSLDNSYKKIMNSVDIELKVDTSNPVSFFDVLREESRRNKESFHLKNVLLVNMGKMKQVNIYVDKSTWNLDKTITCVIDMNPVSTNELKVIENDNSIDFFTGLPNQFSALSEINSLVISTQKSSESFTLFLFGIDHFNEFQTTLGLSFSNQIIKSVSAYLEKYDEEMAVYRMDCDKFLLVVDQTKDDDEMREIAKEIIVNMKRDEKEGVHLTASIGAVSYPTHGENATKLINHVYVALDEAQKSSESNIAFFTNEFQDIHRDEVKMNDEIQVGLKNHEFFLHYQPMFDLKTEDMIGAEALIRWEHPKLGLIPADKFLTVAKKTGLIVDIGEYAFREAIKQRKLWNDEGLRKFKISLNLSLKELYTDKFVQKLEALFEDNDVDPRDFNLDISEKSAMSNIKKTAVDFRAFKELGLSISLDQFGAGASSLKHLQMLPVSTVKIDRSLIFGLYSNLDHQITVKSMIALIHGLGFKVVAEGVETSNESSLLYDYGCDYAQGYLFSKPLPAMELEALLR